MSNGWSKQNYKNHVELKMSNITTLYRGKFVLVNLVDETIELTVENNVYSRSEAAELIAELEQAEPFLLVRNQDGCTYSQQMQDDLEPIPDVKTKPMGLSGDYIIEGGVITHIGGIAVDWTFHTTNDDCEFENE